MITRVVWIAFGIALLGFGVLGVVVMPGGMLIGWSLLGFSIGLCAWRFLVRVSLSRQVFDLPGPEAETGAVTVVASVFSPPDAMFANLSTVELWAAWKRSYFELMRAVDGPDRERLVRQRHEYLDEIERRDGKGFARWLANGAPAGSDPRRYLTTGS
jgi:hypothetical protein